MRRSPLLAIAVGCGAHAHPAPRPAPAGDDLTLYRDRAAIRQRIELDVPAGGVTVKVPIAAGVAADQVLVIDRGGLAIADVHVASAPTDADMPAMPTEVQISARAPRAGRYAIVIGYPTARLRWDAAYTMTANPARDRAVVRGALAIRNATGIGLRVATARVIDAELGAWRGLVAVGLAKSLLGDTPETTTPAAAFELGRLALGEGETRVELISSAPRAMRAVLVYDPIGPRLDSPGSAPLRDPALGTQPPAPAHVTESFEIVRDERATAGLPAGPVRLLAQRATGELAVLGEARVFDAATRSAGIDTIPVTIAEGVTGRRERRELTIDDANHRIVEEFAITLVNDRPRPVDVVIREHLYRGQNWTIAYHSLPPDAAAKEGPQQISLRTEVPATSQAKILYVVVYTSLP